MVDRAKPNPVNLPKRKSHGINRENREDAYTNNVRVFSMKIVSNFGDHRFRFRFGWINQNEKNVILDVAFVDAIKTTLRIHSNQLTFDRTRRRRRLRRWMVVETTTLQMRPNAIYSNCDNPSDLPRQLFSSIGWMDCVVGEARAKLNSDSHRILSLVCGWICEVVFQVDVWRLEDKCNQRTL